MFLEQECAQAERQCQKGKETRNLEMIGNEGNEYWETEKGKFYCTKQSPALGGL